MAVEFERHFGNVRRTHVAYESVEEAEAAGVRPLAWRLVRQPGQWGVSDDGCVVECVRARVYDASARPPSARRALSPSKRRRTAFNLVFTVGPELFVAYDKATGRLASTARFLVRPDLVRPDGPVGRWKDRSAKRDRTRRAVMVLARVVVFHGRPTPEQLALCARIHRPDLKNPAWTLKKFLRTSQGQEMLTNEIAAIFEKAGVSPERTLQYQDEIRGHLVELNTVASLKAAYEVTAGWAEMLGMKRPADALGPAHGDGLPEHDYDDAVYVETHVGPRAEPRRLAPSAPRTPDDEADALAAEILGT